MGQPRGMKQDRWQRAYTTLCNILTKNICTSRDDEYCLDFVVLNYPLWLVTTIIQCVCLLAWRLQRRNLHEN